MAVDAPDDRSRRELMHGAACLAGAWAAAGTLPAAIAAQPQRHARSALVTALGEPFVARQLVVGEPQLFNYPFVASPVFLRW